MVNQIFIEVYSVMAQAEMEKREKRQKEGIEAMKARGEWENYGRPRKVEKDDFRRVYYRYCDDEKWDEILCKKLEISKTTLKRYIKEYL